MSKKAIVIGAGIVGLATARALQLKGYRVTVIDKTEKAVGASIRNFGMIWPIGQPTGKLYNRAIRSREIWQEMAAAAQISYNSSGSLHVAYHKDEWEVLQELQSIFTAENRNTQLYSPTQIGNQFSGIQNHNLLGGLFSPSELIVDPREAIAKLAAYLQEAKDVEFVWGKQINEVSEGKAICGKKIYNADIICICSGADFETLFPDLFNEMPITKCKLQMLRFVSDEWNFRIGTSVCGGLSLIHYKSFSAAKSLQTLQSRYENELANYIAAGIHVMVSQNHLGELTVGDSHEYGRTFDPFDRSEINQLILDYLQTFMKSGGWKLLQTWNGIYPKMTNGETDIFLEPKPGIFIVNGLGGAGMTLSFGYTEEIANYI
ncbi:MAG: TIGR03364 family FAD-dependent oxidoreductase [Chitinophagia bacterium]|nr:TIGR03364 family FAD-dependent oxidoreductase [Chitinophagia bacterium]